MRASLDFAIDGGVVKVDRLALWDELGIAAREPRYAIARKFAPDIAETKLLSIEMNVGRTGALNPFSAFPAATIDDAPHWRFVRSARFGDDEMTVYAPPAREAGAS